MGKESFFHLWRRYQSNRLGTAEVLSRIQVELRKPLEYRVGCLLVAELYHVSANPRRQLESEGIELPFPIPSQRKRALNNVINMKRLQFYPIK